MASHIGKLSKVSMIKEVTLNTLTTPTLPLHATAINIGNVVDTVKDPSFVGKIFTTNLVKVAQSPAGSIPMTAHPAEAGPIFDATLMKNVVYCAGVRCQIAIYYIGTAHPYAEIIRTAGVMSGNTGTSHGSTTPDWSADTSLTAYNTSGKLVAYINTFSNWSAICLGSTTAPCVLGGDFPYTSLGVSPHCTTTLLPFVSASTTAITHLITPAGATDTEPTFNFWQDITLGAGKAIAYIGAMVESLALKITAKSIITATLNLVFHQEITGQTYPSLTIPAEDPFTALKARVFIGGIEAANAKEISLTITNSLDKMSVVGSEFIIQPTRGDATIQISGVVNLDSTEWALRYPEYTGNTPVEIIIYYDSFDGSADSGNGVTNSVLIKIPAVKFSEYKTQASSPGRITSSFAGEAINPGVGDQIQVYVTDNVITTY